MIVPQLPFVWLVCRTIRSRLLLALSSPLLFSIGRNIRHLIDRPDEEHCFRLQKDRVYYLSESVLKAASSLERDSLVSVGTCFGKFTKSMKFRLHITCLDYLAQYSKYKMWIKPQGEMSFLYGNNVLKVRHDDAYGGARSGGARSAAGVLLTYSLFCIPCALSRLTWVV